MSTATMTVHARIAEATEEAKNALGHVKFTREADWIEALDLVSKCVAARIRVQVLAGQWADAGVTDASMLRDMRVQVTRTVDGINVSVTLPTIMQSIRNREVPFLMEYN